MRREEPIDRRTGQQKELLFYLWKQHVIVGSSKESQSSMDNSLCPLVGRLKNKRNRGRLKDRENYPWTIECFLEDLFLGGQSSIILGYRRNERKEEEILLTNTTGDTAYD